VKPEIALGTVQFGLAYGVAGRGEAVPPGEIRAILDGAWSKGIRVLDTAPVYGDIEQRLAALAGANDFTIVSKVPAVPEALDEPEAVAFVRDAVRRSRERLGERLRVLLFHRGVDLCGEQGARLYAAAREGAPGVKLGASVYSPAEALRICAHVPIEVVQVPGNILDQRLAAAGIAEQLRGIEIHVRSVFLQGLLLMSARQGAARVPAAREALGAWETYCRDRRSAPLEVALGAARGLPGVRYCVVGVDRASQLAEICDAWRSGGSVSALELAVQDERVIDPRQWAAT
jgi:aryl-alcohol dehydrogenase-like predicted oxidoreductase